MAAAEEKRSQQNKLLFSQDDSAIDYRKGATTTLKTSADDSIIDRKKTPTKSSVVKDLMDLYKVDEHTAKNIIAYDSASRMTLNKMLPNALIADTYEIQSSAATTILQDAKELSSAVPVFGTVVGLASYGMSRLSKSVETRYNKETAQNVLEFSGTGDAGEWCQFTKELTNAALDKEKIAKLSKMESVDDAKKLGEIDAKVVGRAILDGKMKGKTILSDGAIEDLAYMTHEPSQKIKVKDFKQVAENEAALDGHHTHHAADIFKREHSNDTHEKGGVHH